MYVDHMCEAHVFLKKKRTQPLEVFQICPPPPPTSTQLISSFHTHALGVEMGGVVAGEGTFGPLKRGLKGVVS